MRPFRFSVTVTSASSAEEWRAIARKAEDQGFDVLVTPDHLADLYSPLLPLVTAAEATTRLRVGTLVLNNDFRHPALVAREAATLAHLTGGRFELGVGAGHAAPEYASIGLTFDPPSTRVARLAESVAIIRRLLAGETVDFTGEHYRIAGHRAFPIPAEAVPILVGGNGRALLRLAAREADIVGFTGLGKTLADGIHHDPSGFRLNQVREQVALVRQAAGARFSELELNCLVQQVTITDNRRAAADALAAAIPPLTAADALSTPFALLGTPRQIADDLLARRDDLGLSYISVFAHTMDAMAKAIPFLK